MRRWCRWRYGTARRERCGKGIGIELLAMLKAMYNYKQDVENARHIWRVVQTNTALFYLK